MERTVYRYVFAPKVSLPEAELCLLLACTAAQGLHGEARVRLEAGFLFDKGKRACAVEASTPVGEAVARIFTGFLTKEFGAVAFTVERAPSPRSERRAVPEAEAGR